MALSYSQGLGTTPLLGETIGENFDRAVATYPDRDALVVRHQSVHWTYRELADEVDRAARALAGLGLGKGDRVGIWAPNCAEWVVTQFATAKLGVILVNINPAYRTTELAYALRQSGCKALVSATAFKTSDYRAMIDEVRGDLPRARARALHRRRPVRGRARRGRVARARPLRADQHPVHERHHRLAQGRHALATRTSSTTATSSASSATTRRRTASASRCPSTTASAWSWATSACVSHGACMVIPAPSFEPAATLAAVAEQRCTSLYGVPTMFIAELEDPSFDDHDLSSLRTGIMAGSPCPEQVMRKVIDRMNMEGVTICYGMTETSPVSTQTTADDELERRVGTVGRVHPHVEVKIVDPETGRLVAARRAGRAVHPRLQRDARLLGGPGAHQRGDRRVALHAHRRPRDDGRRRAT